MNKNQGIFVGAILAAALMFRPSTPSSPQISETSHATGSSSASQAPGKKSTVFKEGPWLASCRYWAPVRDPSLYQPDPGEEAVTSTVGKLSGSNSQVNVFTGQKEEPEDQGCTPGPEQTKGLTEEQQRGLRWGLPKNTAVDVTAIIATVPDPVHTHLSLTFDRTVDVILQGASDNGYVSSYYWLPWRNSASTLKDSEGTGDKEPGRHPEREREPGLIVLKKLPPLSATAEQSYYKVIYLFLVAETPTLGVDGAQLQNAFSYESELANTVKEFKGTFSASMDPKSDVSIIGPIFSGSAASLRAGVQATPEMAGHKVTALGATGTDRSVDQLIEPDKDKHPSPVHYFSFLSRIESMEHALFNLTDSSGYRRGRIALLTEDNTAFGKSTSDCATESGDTDDASGDNASAQGKTVTAHGKSTTAPRKSATSRAKSATSRARSATSQGTADGNCDGNQDPTDGQISIIRFPREISQLRNAESDQSGNSAASSGSIPSPFLHFSIKDSGAQDSVPQFSIENSPLSQEAQLMAMARQLDRSRFDVVVIDASNQLDTIFLAQFVRRFCPDARLVFAQSDLMLVREIDDVPFIGSVTIGPYDFMTLASVDSSAQQSSSAQQDPSVYRAYTDDSSAAYYNAASYTFWDRSSSKPPTLFGYPPIRPGSTANPKPLWATSIGSDGYFPLGVLWPCPDSNSKTEDFNLYGRFLPQIGVDGELSPPQPCESKNGPKKIQPTDHSKTPVTIYPAWNWVALCVFLSVLCLSHGVMLLLANHRSPLTRDLSIEGNDQPRRRSMYLHVCSTMLASATFIVAVPLYALHCWIPIDTASLLASDLMLLSAAIMLAITLRETRKTSWWSKYKGKAPDYWRVNYIYGRIRSNIYFLFNLLAWLTFLGVALCWSYICIADHKKAGDYTDFVGLSFSYRCIHPFNGVSPVLPIVLVLLGWYAWAFLQTRRLRFSETGRPFLPKKLDGRDESYWFVCDEELASSKTIEDCGLFNNMTCLFFTRQLFCRIFKIRNKAWDAALFALCLAALAFAFYWNPVKSVDRFLWATGKHMPTPFEFLYGYLLLPLLWCSFTGWLRVMLIWASLKSGLLDALEMQPIREAFNRLHGEGWMSMLGRVGSTDQSHDIYRSVESIRHTLQELDSEAWVTGSGKTALKEKADEIYNLTKELDGRSPGRSSLELTRQIEGHFAEFARELLSHVLILFWKGKRKGLVESEQTTEPPGARHYELLANQPGGQIELRATPVSEEPALIPAAEEFVALRYMVLIRVVLANLSCLITFISLTFVLSIAAWNSYPFQPRQVVNWIYTAHVLLLGAGVIWVFAQMHRDPILSRVTNTKPNELGWDFYFRIISFGAVPIFAWLAYEFPDISSAIYRFIQPGSGVFK